MKPISRRVDGERKDDSVDVWIKFLCLVPLETR